MTQERIIDDKKAPFQTYRVAQGSTIMVIGGPVKFTSEKPPECMTIEYVKGSEKTYNYFSCKTCGSNWICEQCRKSCHESLGHQTLPHLTDHKPSYACCYCVKKGLCKIKNIKNNK